MKLSINWLKEYVDVKLSTEQLVERLTMAGLEVEEVHSVGNDTVLDIEITPNRPDCLNTIGLAREVSAITSKNLKLPKIKTYLPKKTAASIVVAIENKKDCTRYVATVIKNVAIGQSPAKIADRLNSLGIKSISNAVDVTNFVMMELGQPLHVFDLDKIEGGKVVVRRAKAGETIVTIDGVERKLDPSILVIADAQKPIAIAGIMGGKATEVTAATNNILLESAQFDMGLVRRASRTLGLKSDSSYRFERGVDLEGVLKAANRATDLILELSKAKVDGRSDTCSTKIVAKKPIVLSTTDIENLLGTKVSAATVKAALTRLGLGVAVTKSGVFKIKVPGFRGDLNYSVDIIEEVARIIGYDKLDVSFPRVQVVNIEANNRPQQVRKIIRSALIAQGYYETITYSLIGQKDLEKTNLTSLPTLILKNWLSQEYSILRPSILPSLLSVASTNFGRGQKSLRFFEIGKRYFKGGERWTLGLLLAGNKDQDWRKSSDRKAEIFDLGIEQTLSQIGINNIVWSRGVHEGLSPEATGQIKLNDVAIGVAGKVADGVLKNWDIGISDVYFAEIDLALLDSTPKPTIKYVPVSPFPAVRRDISISVRLDVPYSHVKDLCLKLGGEMLHSVALIEEYKGDKIQSGQRGLVFSLVYQLATRTLREEEVSATHQQILNQLSATFGAVLR